ncbi:MAG: hypothetical protein OEW73_12265 [Gammaproteobacteria bacterium]|nr:hypothetical protein [Gammaproteobacteria bacterium]MDH5241550.1 hypothetical protein [Gammaproteobacteria bacterium]MDH5262485.1 hypothetical protein [Gammaproteobacteria bacterium]MDH5584048.1 hypothetical protein [Gammaproteobacteria bacterium]
MSGHGFPAAAKELAKGGQLVEAVKVPLEQTGLNLKDARDAIKHTRTTRSLGLKAAKETVEHFLEKHGDIDTRFRAASLTEFRRVAGKLATILVLIGKLAFGYVYWLAA